jgi:hypothetical protein
MVASLCRASEYSVARRFHLLNRLEGRKSFPQGSAMQIEVLPRPRSGDHNVRRVNLFDEQCLAAIQNPHLASQHAADMARSEIAQIPRPQADAALGAPLASRSGRYESESSIR